ncbi:sensory neuron membrane protein 1 [Hetaerina americana]|uniref:sensory neuron membrane protein 1 n=1 Tax=Hetaerina americana TaxID=62018 RepID=UPI003A7F5137
MVTGIICYVLGSLILIAGCVLGFVVFPNLIQKTVAENVLLKEGSQSWDLWKKLPIPLRFEVYFFNVSNVKDINNGQMPLVQEIGPYVYQEYREKVDIVTNEKNGTAAYYQKTNFVFDPEASGGLKETDKITILNVAIMKNNTFDGRYEVKLGWSENGPTPTVEGVRQLGEIVRWQNSSTLSTWSGEKCNKITGTDATIFHPYLTKDSRIDIFSTDLCRSLTALYDSDSSYKGIDSLKFTAHERLLADVNKNPDNYCYCPTDNACMLRGALDLTPCQGAPAVITFPHFYMADEKYLTMVSGLKPVKEKHETFLEIEPNTGVPLNGGKRVQFNMMLKKIKDINIIKNAPSALFPVAWINEGVELDDANVNKLKDQLVNNLKIVAGVQWTLIGIGIALILAGTCFIILAKVKFSKKGFSL